jgi:probable H4MPT-linked C1 transfer pathway protein
MNLNSFSVVGLDIGGANIKAVLLEYQKQKITRHDVAVRPFEIWKNPTALATLLKEMAGDLRAPEFSRVAVTMTAELSDAFRTKREGVLYILEAVAQAFGKSFIYFFGLEGFFLRYEVAKKIPLLCAASNWLASAQYLAQSYPDCILIDIGSTSTDIIPIQQGTVINKGSTDPERLRTGELVYSGILRTNPNTIINQVPMRGSLYRVAAENFTCMADVYLILGKIESSSYSCPTPDGRAKTVVDSQERLARLVCADSEIMNVREIENLASYLLEKHLQQITEALSQVLSGQNDTFDLQVMPVGTGSFLAKEVARRLHLSLIDIDQDDSCSASLTALPAYAVAYLLAQDETGMTDD